MKRLRWVWVGLIVSLAIGGLLSLIASPHPDGLERVAQNQGFIGKAVQTPLLRSPLADYLFPGIRDERLATALAGFLGTLALFGAGCGVGMLIRRGRKPRRGQ